MPYLELGSKPQNFGDPSSYNNEEIVMAYHFPEGDENNNMQFEHKFLNDDEYYYTSDELESPDSEHTDAISLSVNDYALPPETVEIDNPFNKHKEDVVMVVPTSVTPDKEVVAGFIFVGVSIILMCLFSLFVYLGYVQYSSLLNKKTFTSDLESGTDSTQLGKLDNTGSLESKNSVYSESNKDVTDIKINEQQNPYIIKHSFGSSNLNQFDRYHHNYSQNNNFKSQKSVNNHNINNYYNDVKLKAPQFSHHRQDYFKPFKTTPNVKDIENYFCESASKEYPSKIKSGLDTSIGCDTPVSITFDLPKKKRIINQEINNVDTSRANSLRMLEKYRKESRGLSAFINEENNQSKISKPIPKKNKKSHKKGTHNGKITYTINELVELEPIDIYQMFEYSYDDGDLLVTDLIFPSIPLAKTNLTLTEIEKELTDVRNTLMNKSRESVTKVLELFRFITFSFGIKAYDNPKIFTLPYGILVDTIIQFDLIGQIPDHLTLVLQSGFIETVIMYCINCWKFDKIKNDKFLRIFELWNTTPYIPTKLKLYKYIVTLLLQGYRSSLLKEVLIYFSMPPSPHFLQNVITEALKSDSTDDIYNLLQYLRRQLQEEHHECCSNTEKWKHWEFTSAGMENNKNTSNMVGLVGSKDHHSKNKTFTRSENIKKKQQLRKIKETAELSQFNNESENVVSEFKENIPENNSKVNLQSLYPNQLIFDPTELPGSLMPSPIHASPKHI